MALQAYIPEADIQVEFLGPSAKRLLTLSSRQKYADIFMHADVLVRSCFLKILLDNHSPLNMVRKERVEKLKRCLGKVCQYVSGIPNLIQRAKRRLPIAHHWVTDTFAGTGEGWTLHVQNIDQLLESQNRNEFTLDNACDSGDSELKVRSENARHY